MERRQTRLVRTVLVLVAALWLVRGADAQVQLSATLSTAQEVPTPTGTNANAGATATFTFNVASKTIDYEITVHDLTAPAVAAHIHQAPPGVPGPIIINLDQATLKGTTTALTDAQKVLLFDGGLYANVHTAQNPNGEIRGQITLAAPKCHCQGTSRADFKKCVKSEIKKLDKAERKDEGIRALRRAVKKSSCGRTKGPKKSIACCLPQTPEANIVVGHVCAPVPEKACSKLGGVSGGASCFPNNPCRPPASPSGAFLDGAAGGIL